MFDFIFEGLFAAIPLMLIGAIALQVLALKRFTGGWWIAAMVPAVAMGAAIAVAVLGVAAGSNLAPIWVVFAAPPCFLWLAVLWIARVLSGAGAR